jgi:hypothetical protein
MANLLIGSSNVNRHYRIADFPELRKYKMLKCTQVEGFEAYMGGLVVDNKSVLISVIENFIIDAVGAETTKPEQAIDSCIKSFLQCVFGRRCQVSDNKIRHSHATQETSCSLVQRSNRANRNLSSRRDQSDDQ